MKFLQWVDKLNIAVGRFVSYLIWIGMAIIVWEVIGRYVFNSPSVWAPGYTQRIFAGYFILIGAYTLIQGGHVRVDLLLNTRFPRWNNFADLLNFTILVIWAGAMSYEAWYYFIDAWTFNELDDSALRHPMWPVNLSLFIGVVLITLQGIAGMIRSCVLIFKPTLNVDSANTGAVHES